MNIPLKDASPNTLPAIKPPDQVPTVVHPAPEPDKRPWGKRALLVLILLIGGIGAGTW